MDERKQSQIETWCQLTFLLLLAGVAGFFLGWLFVGIDWPYQLESLRVRGLP